MSEQGTQDAAREWTLKWFEVSRVSNGWIVRTTRDYHDTNGMTNDMLVFMNRTELALWVANSLAAPGESHYNTMGFRNYS